MVEAFQKYLKVYTACITHHMPRSRYVVVVDPNPADAPRIGFDETYTPALVEEPKTIPVSGVHYIAYVCSFLLAFQLTLLMSDPSAKRLLDTVFAFVGLYAVILRVDASLILIAVHCVYIVPSVVIAVCTGEFRRTQGAIRVSILVVSAFVNILAISLIMGRLEASAEEEQSRDDVT